ncbi:MAG TPA: GNAT family protein [Bryobacteraceae bacterium]|nr:GNAT family protein [Bryobacteraceae bacterium]
MFRAPIMNGFELRPLEERHAPMLYRTTDENRVYLREWLPWVDATITEDDTLAFIRSTLAQTAANEGFAAGIWQAGERESIIGVIGTHKINWLNRKVELGYWIAQDFQGRGIVTAACRLAIAYLFRDLELNRVEIQCATRNRKSKAIAERLGFAHEGVRREAELCCGEYHDLDGYAMLRRDWKG